VAVAERREEWLVHEGKAGNNAAFAEIVRLHRQNVVAFLRRFGLDPAEAEDVAQDTFVAAWARLAAYRGDSTLRAWLCGIAYRKALTRYRGTRRREQRHRRAGELVVSTGDPRPTAGMRADVRDALARLPPEQRAAVALCLGSDFSDAEAARVLDRPLGTVKSHLRRGRIALAAALGDYRER
jgi:RNA polymerase sigma-70 factor (ECF subfamily)